MMCKEYFELCYSFFFIKKNVKYCVYYFVFIVNICNNFINDIEFLFFVKMRGYCILIINCQFQNKGVVVLVREKNYFFR